MTETVTASVFMSGRSQAVRIPKAFQFKTDRVKIRMRGKDVILTPIEKEDEWANWLEVCGTFPEDFFEEDEFFKDRPIYEYPRMGANESWEHFEERVQQYYDLREQEHKEWLEWKAKHE